MHDTGATGRPGLSGLRAAAVAAVLIGAALPAVGCGRGGGSSGVSGSSGYQKDVAFAHCMRTHGVPDFPDPLPQGGFPRNSLPSGPAMTACQHLLPPIQPVSAAQQARVLAHDLKWAKCMRGHGFPGISDPAVRPHASIVITVPASFDPFSPKARAAAKACRQLEGPVLITPGGGS
jgi:hypothetical protein